MNIAVDDDAEPEFLEPYEHWGELPEPTPPPTEFNYAALAAVDVKPEGLKTKMPLTVEKYDEDALILPPDDSLATEVLKHNIRLNRHTKEVGRLIINLEKNPSVIRECPPMPPMAKCKRTDRIFQQDVSMEKQRLRHSLTRSQSLPPVVDDEVLQKMLEKSVIMIMAQVGFDRADKSALLVFVDVVKDLLLKVSLMSHELNQRDITEGNSAYTDVLEKAFRSVGFSGLDCVKDYFRKTVLTKRKLAHQKSKYLMMLYNQRVAEHVRRSGVLEGAPDPAVPSSSSAMPVPEYSPSAEPLQ